jgi:hypothetical protein
MKRFHILIALAVILCGIVSVRAAVGTPPPTTFVFRTVNFPGDTFTQLLGINDFDTIAGYHGAKTNKGFVLTLPNSFTDENFPNSDQTQVIGINNRGDTAGFYITAGVTTARRGPSTPALSFG